ncbi:MAG: hypothetical protein MI757_20890 [Pirellulales bacterium]|nr:hypothetical protein [Pirellulales bacterium]
MFVRILFASVIVGWLLAGVSPQASFSAEAEKDKWSWSKLNPFRRDDTPLIRPANTRKIAPNRFKPTRSAKKPGKSPWQVVSDGSKKMFNGTKNLFTFGGSEKSDSARRPAPPSLRKEPPKGQSSLTSWLPWSKTKKR